MSLKNFFHRLNYRDTRIVPKIFKPIFIIILIIGVFFLAKNNLAQTPTPDQSTNDDWTKYSLIKQKQDAIKKGNNQESWLFESLSSNAVSFLIALVGEIPDSVLQGKSVGWIPGGMIGQTTKLAANTFYQPVSGIQYIAQLKDNFLGKPTYAAQGIGFAGLAPLIPIWQVFRNMVYVLFSIVLVGIGLSIMLRIKISPQAVITIQSAIPKLITSLILVTFSYAIAGLLIDLSYVIQALLFNTFAQGIPNLSSFIPTTNGIMDAGTTFSTLFFLTPLNIYKLLGALLESIFINMNVGSALAVTAITVFNPSVVLGGLIMAVVGATILEVILAIIVFILIIKFFVGLIKCYFNLILKILLGPLEIAMGAIPNSKLGFGTWILQVVANLAVFPICSLYIILVSFIIRSMSGSLWIPPILSFSHNGSTPADAFTAIFGIGAVLLLPKLPSMIPEFIFQIKPSPYGKAIGEGLGNLPGKGIVGMAKSGVNEFASDAVSNRLSNSKLGRGMGKFRRDFSGGAGAGGPKTTPTTIEPADDKSGEGSAN